MLLATGSALRLAPWVSTAIVGLYKKEIGGDGEARLETRMHSKR